MNFISQRQSLASDFANEVQNSSSMLSSRRHVMDEGADGDLYEFRQQINYKFVRSIANKTYTYPLMPQGYQLIDDEEEFKDLAGVEQYNLFGQSQQTVFKKDQFKIKKGSNNKNVPDSLQQKFSSKTANLLLSTLQSEILKINNMRSYIGDTLKNKNPATMISKDLNDFKAIRQEAEGQSYRKRRLQTQPYEKPMGFIIKKK